MEAAATVHDESGQALLDAEHLRLLRLGYLVSGGANVLFACFPLIHVAIGVAMLLGGFAFPHTGAGAPPPRAFGLIFIVIGGMFSSVFAAAATLKLARYLRQRRRRVFCLISAALSCIGFPYGTALGVATVLVVNRPSIAALFEPQANR